MPRNPEKNALVREERRKKILEAALSVYVRLGYHGTDMDAVAAQAGIAKGLLYYYFKTKKELFAELYAWFFGESFALSEAALEETKGENPVLQLMHYTYAMFLANEENPCLMQFAMRVPFDAYAIFGPDGWMEGAQKSDVHRTALAGIIDRGITQGVIPKTDASRAANSFWTVFVGNIFAYSKLMLGRQAVQKADKETFCCAVQFCFQGLGIPYALWHSCMEQVIEKCGKETENESLQK